MLGYLQATEFCERFDGVTSLGRFAFDAREEWTIRLKQWDPNPAFYPLPMGTYLGEDVAQGGGLPDSIIPLWQSRADPWPTNLRCAHAPPVPAAVLCCVPAPWPRR